MSETGRGVAAMVVACLIWGLVPIFYKQLVHIDALEILAHRTFWSFLLFTLLLMMQGRVGALGAALGDWKTARVIALAAAMISINWGLYIMSVQWGRVTESALGYYIFPLVAVMLGRVVLGEVLSRAQWTAVALAVAGVLVLTAGLGAAPWISIILSLSFGVYGIVKKQLSVGPIVSVTAEAAIVGTIGLAWLIWLETQGRGVFGEDHWDSFLLVLSGALTATPLILFSYAAKRVNLSTIGLLQYINPTGQFLCAVVLFAEPFTGWHMAAFGLIWVALALYSASAIAQDRASRRVAMAASGDGTTEISARSEASAKP
ncbi:EamA family transporter RarD [Alisedimentitalea sp. MJ-SS2]|uniref:EamA family transporter RarD n=1 Tax=Aliisedimentitalea sp. MJ-SS2 TaxID=3049795 RepID=UPI00290CE7CA|nr:EamA family transporter RarD [Alisedimentitalea sp. MJ-SS2]MDU8928941.1 EamA family transporter RarD [Alisedimentitalea sp. MJ-SS2]